MDPDTYGHDAEPDRPQTYWRRRVFALCGVLAILALLAWACSGAAGRGDERRDAAVGLPAARPDAAASPSAAVPTVTVTVTARVTTTPSALPRRPRPGDACDARDVVVTLTADAAVYRRGRNPHLTMSVVNTGRVTCTFDVGPKALRLRITSGADRVWSSADCVAGDGSDIRRLAHGIPYDRSFAWDRRRSRPGCAGGERTALPGTYVAQLVGPRVRSDTVVFHLR